MGKADRRYIEIFGMVIQELSYEIIEAIGQIAPSIQFELLQRVDFEKPTLVITHIKQSSQADDIEWSVGDMILIANNKEVNSLIELKAIIDNNKSDTLLLECANKRIGYFTTE